MNNHDDIRKLLSAYSGDDLEKTERLRVEEHLAVCASCRAELTDLQAALHLIRTTPESEPPDWLASRIMARVREQQVKRNWLQRIFFPLHIKLPIEALALLLVCVSGYYMARNAETELQQPASQQEIPAAIQETGKPVGSVKQVTPLAAPQTTAPPPASIKEHVSEENIPAQPSASKTTEQVAPQFVPTLPGKVSPQPGFAPAPPIMKGGRIEPAAESSYIDTKSFKDSQGLGPAERAMPAAAEMKRKAFGKGYYEKFKSEETRVASGTPPDVALPQVIIRLNMYAPASAPGSLKEAVIRSGGVIIDENTTQHAGLKVRIPTVRLEELLELLGRLGRILEQPSTRNLQGIVEIKILW